VARDVQRDRSDQHAIDPSSRQGAPVQETALHRRQQTEGIRVSVQLPCPNGGDHLGQHPVLGEARKVPPPKCTAVEVQGGGGDPTPLLTLFSCFSVSSHRPFVTLMLSDPSSSARRREFIPRPSANHFFPMTPGLVFMQESDLILSFYRHRR
jgi:hypothetical protein